MESVYSRVVAGIDVHKKMLAVVVVAAENPEIVLGKAKFGTTTGEIRVLADWLGQWKVTEAAMESTAQYWRPVWLGLEKQFRLYLAQARSTAAPKGRKWDYRDAWRIAKRLLADDLTLSFVPDAEQRDCRLLTRARTQFVDARARIRNQMEGILEEGRIKLSGFVSDLLGVNSRKILQALIGGETDPEELAEIGASALKAGREALREALSGSLNETHRTLLRIQLEGVQQVERAIADIDRTLSRTLWAHQDAITRLCEVPGISVTAARQILAEIGVDAAAFPSAEQLASWVGVCPGREESAGVSSSNRSPKGNRQMRRLLSQIAHAAVRSKGTFFSALFRRLVPRLGVNKAIWAVAHRMLRLIWKILHGNVRYQEQGPKPLSPESVQRKKRTLMKQLRDLGVAFICLDPGAHLPGSPA